MLQTRSVFKHIAQLVQVSDLARPLGPELSSSLTCAAALEAMEAHAAKAKYDPAERVSLVKHEGAVVGWTSFPDVTISEKGRIVDLIKTIPPGEMLSAELNALAAVPLLTSREGRSFFVLQGNSIIGTLQYSDLFGPAFRLCLLALTLQLEESALRYLLLQADSAIRTLGEGRLAKAREVCALRFGSKSDEQAKNLVRSTTFIDKATMLVKLNVMTEVEAEHLHSVFVKAGNLRNDCAHPTAETVRAAPTVNERELGEFIEDCHRLIKILDEQFDKSTVTMRADL